MAVLGQNAPLVAFFIWRESRAVANLNYYWQLIALIFHIVTVIVWIFVMEFYDVPSYFCEDVSLNDVAGADRELTSCEKSARLWIYVATGFFVLFLPFQYLIV